MGVKWATPWSEREVSVSMPSAPVSTSAPIPEHDVCADADVTASATKKRAARARGAIGSADQMKTGFVITSVDGARVWSRTALSILSVKEDQV